MKILVLSDIHGNLPALEAVIEQEQSYDACLFLGDVVDYGPFPAECIHFLMEEMDVGVVGNHDNAIVHNTDCGCRGDFKKFSEETRAWHKTLLGKKEIRFLRALRPIAQTVIDGRAILMAHATPQGDLFHYLQDNEIEKAVADVTDQIVLLGHTHIQFSKLVGRTLVVNPGSVGLSRDGRDACYATIRDGEVELHRISYDVERTVESLHNSPISDESKRGLTAILRGHTNSIKDRT